MKRTTQACAVLAVLLTASAALGQTSTVTTDYTAAGNTYIVRVAAHTLEAGTVVYQKTDGKAAKANYYYQDRSVVIGICTAKALQHQPAIIQTAGEIHIDRNAQWPQFSTLVPGHVYGLYDSGGFLRDIHTLATTSSPLTSCPWSAFAYHRTGLKLPSPIRAS